MEKNPSLEFVSKKQTEIEKIFETHTETGLKSENIQSRQKQYGKNILESKKVTWWHILLRQFTSPFMYLLLGAAVLSYFLGENIDGTMIVLFIVINTALGFYQEYKSENIAAALKSFLKSYTIVRRDGVEKRIEKSDLVPGDIVIVEPGDIIPADIRFVEVQGLEVNESVLTGEAEGVTKIAEPLQKVKALYEARNIGFAGSTVSSGRGIGIVIGTGLHTAFGKISELSSKTVRVSSFELGMKKVSSMILKIIGVTFIFIFLLKLIFSDTQTDLLQFIIFSIALAVSVIPEGLPLVITFTLSHGAKRLAKSDVVVKRLSSIEDLGSIEVLCSDKTGTLTENKMRISQICEDPKNETLFFARLSSVMPTREQPIVNPFDEAIFAGIKKTETKILEQYIKTNEVPFDPIRKRNAVLLKNKKNTELVVRGAYEEVVKLCSKISAKTTREHEQFILQEGKLGHRVLALAHKKVSAKSTDIKSEEHDLEFVGLLSFYDPLKASSLEALKKAESLGVKIKILTGDSKEVSGAVGKQAGLISDESQVITGETFIALSIPEQREAAEKYIIFARVSPEQKYAIIEILQKSYTVGFLGEGINDAPALKVAHVGMVVSNASDVAREAADIILLQKSLSVIIDGIEEGRRVFANNVKYLKSTMASNFGNFYAVVVASFLAGYLPMLPIQILLLNLLSDFPMMSIANDTVDSAELEKPRQYNIKDIFLVCTILGIISTVFDFFFFGIFFQHGPDTLRSNWFIASVVTELAFLFSIRTKGSMFKAIRPSKTVFALTGIAAVLTVALPFTTFGTKFFSLRPPTLSHILIIFGALIAYIFCTEIAKRYYYKFEKGSE
jgi:Mg2+-importing ATPase